MILQLALLLLMANWPAWRGPEGLGISTDQSVPDPIGAKPTTFCGVCRCRSRGTQLRGLG